jgi:hypothetical protein
MKFLSILTSFLLAEAEERVFVIVGVSDWHISETSSETFKHLLLLFLSEEKLHVAANGVVGSLVNTNEIAPFE